MARINIWEEEYVPRVSDGYVAPTTPVPTYSDSAVTPTVLQNYFDSNPLFSAEYERNRAANPADTRSPLEWLGGGLDENERQGGNQKSELLPFLSPAPVAPAAPASNNFFDSIFNSPVVTNPQVDVISTPVVNTPSPVQPLPNSPDKAETDFISQAIDAVTSIISAKPASNTTINTDNSQTFISEDTYNVTQNYGYSASETKSLIDSVTTQSKVIIDSLLDLVRFPTLSSVPSNGNILSPSDIPTGYAKNFEQSKQRLGTQVVATLSGGSRGGGIGGTGISWRQIIIGAIVSLLVYLAYKRLTKR